MKKIFLITALFFTAISIAQTRIGNTDRQKIDSLSFVNDTLNIRIENDVLRKVKITRAALTTTYDNTTSGLTAPNVKAALDELDLASEDNRFDIQTNSESIGTLNVRQDSIVNILASPPTSNMTFNNQNVDYTVVENDGRDDVVIRLDYNNETMTLPSGVFSDGNLLRVAYASVGVGDAYIKEGADIDILGYSNGITLNSYPSGVTLAKISGTTPELWEVVDYYGSIADYSTGITIESQTSNNDNAPGNTNMTVNKPSGVQIGDHILVMGWSREFDNNSDIYTPATGFTEIAEMGETIADAHVFAAIREVDGTEGASFTFTQNTAVAYGITAVRLSGVNSANPTDQIGTEYSTTGASHAVTGVTTTNDNSIAFVVVGTDGSDMNATTATANWVEGETVDTSDTFNHTMGAWWYIEKPTAGATGTVTFTSSQGDGLAGFQFNLNAN